MSYVALRQPVNACDKDALTRMVESHAGPGCALVDAYWTPGQQQLLSVFRQAGANGPNFGQPPPEVLPVLPITAEEYGPPAMTPAAGNGDGLQLVLVRRHLDPATYREFRSIALQAIMCAYEYTDLLWLRSFWAREQNELLCVFRTRTHDLVREHAYRSRIPCDEVYDAVELRRGELTPE